MSTLKERYPFLERAHLETMRGNFLQNEQYCSKQATLVEFGTKPVQNGARADKNEIYALAKKGASILEIMDHDFAAYCRFRVGLSDYFSLVQPKRADGVELEVILFFGEPGCGKTELALAQFEDTYRLPIGDKFWLTPSALGKKHILIDDFKSNLSIESLLQLLDKYAVEAERKGAHIWWNPDSVIITTNRSPHDWYPKSYAQKDWAKEALFRRFTACYRFYKNEEKVPRPIEIDISNPNHFDRNWLPPQERPNAFQILMNEVEYEMERNWHFDGDNYVEQL